MRYFEVTPKNKNWTIAIDMDGVLADFDGGCIRCFGKHPDEMEKEELWSAISNHSKNVEPFFETLEVLPDAFELMDFVISNFEHHFILSATGGVKSTNEQKIKWIRKVFGPYLTVILTERSADKAHYAKPHRILIDDREVSTIPWESAGGVAILHKNTQNTINTISDITS